MKNRKNVAKLALVLALIVAMLAVPQMAMALSAPPSEIYKAADWFGSDFNLTFTDVDWVKAVSAVTVNGTAYTKGSSSFSVDSNTTFYAAEDYEGRAYVRVGEGWAGEDDNAVCVVSATGYTDLVLLLNRANHTAQIHSTHTGGTATCTQQAVCTVCGQPYGELGAHAWSNAQWTWSEDHASASVTLTCQNDAAHTTMAQAAVSSEEAQGKVVYTATAEVDGQTYTDTVEVAVSQEVAPNVTVPERTEEPAAEEPAQDDVDVNEPTEEEPVDEEPTDEEPIDEEPTDEPADEEPEAPQTGDAAASILPALAVLAIMAAAAYVGLRKCA